MPDFVQEMARRTARRRGCADTLSEMLGAGSRAIRRFFVSIPAIALVAALALVAVGAVSALEHRLMDFRFSLVQRPATGDLIIVEIDHASLGAIGVWPWPRQLHAELIDRLTAAGVRGIAIDVDFSSASTSAADAALAEALERAGGLVVLPVFDQDDLLGQRGGTLRYTGPLPMFSDQAHLASVSLQPGEDGLVRLFSLTELWNDDFVPSMGAVFAGVEQPRANEFYLDFGIDPRSLPRISFADLLQDRVDPEGLDGKLVIVGATAIELSDLASVPVHRVLPGVAVQALGYESIVQGRMILRSSPLITWGIALLLAFSCGPRFVRWPWRVGLLVLLTGSASLVAASIALQAVAPVSLDVVVWIVVLGASFLAALMQGTDALAARIMRKGVALLHRMATMRAMLDDSFDGILFVNEAGRIEHANPAAASMLGQEPRALMGQSAAILFKDATTDPSKAGKPQPAVLVCSDGSHISVELVVRKSDLRGSVQYLDGRHRPRVVAVWTFRDITERKRAEEAQEAALQEAVAAARAKSEFIANMSHELRTPLNAIIGFSEMIKEQMLGHIGVPAYASYAADIHASGTRLHSALTGILDIARIEGGSYTLNEESVALDDAVATAVSAVAAGAQDRYAQIVVPPAGTLPTVRADARAMHRILVGLLSNAVKFCDNEPRIAVSGGIDSSGDCYLSVADNGIGIPQEHLEKVMRPFQQADTSLGRPYEGLGLGLTLASGLMQLHEGSLAVASARGAGTTVTIRFPAGRVIR